MTISLIVAMSRERAIGQNNTLPWHLPPDLKRFKTLTMGHPLIMGRKTFESIGRALPGRTSIVLTRQALQMAGATVASTLESALQEAAKAPGAEEIFVIGGGEIYTLAIAHAQRVYLTHVDINVPEADAFFPELPEKDWHSVKKDFYPATDESPAFIFEILQRRY